MWKTAAASIPTGQPFGYQVDHMKRDDLLNGRRATQTKNGEGRVSMVVTYSSFLPDIITILQTNRRNLYRSLKLRKIFPNDLMVAFKRGKNLQDLLVHGKTRRALTYRGRQDCGGGCVISKEFFLG